MKNFLIILLILLLCVSALVACSEAEDPYEGVLGDPSEETVEVSQWDRLENPPALFLNLTIENQPLQQIQSLQNGASWQYVSQDGSTVGWNADSPHPLQLMLSDFNPVTLHLNESEGYIELEFSVNSPPVIITAKRWPAEFATESQDIDGVYNLWEMVELSDKTLNLVNNGHSYIYELTVEWPGRGRAAYVFRVISEN